MKKYINSLKLLLLSCLLIVSQQTGAGELILKDGVFIISNKPASQQTPTDTVVNINAYYVSTTGNDANDGKTEDSAFRTIQHAVTKAMPGETVYVKAGNYGNEQIVFPRSGTLGNPITLEGYQTTPGDSPTYTDLEIDDGNLVLDPNRMPLLVGTDVHAGKAISGVSVSYIHVKHFQAKEMLDFVYFTGGSFSNRMQGIHVSHTYARDLGDGSSGWTHSTKIGKHANNSSITDTVCINATGAAIETYGDYNEILRNRIYHTAFNEDGSARSTVNFSYPLTIRGNYNTINNNYLHMLTDGHGIDIVTDKNGNWDPSVDPLPEYHEAKYNTINHNTVIGGDNGIEFRHTAEYNTADGNTLTGVGIHFMDGASHNTVTNTIVNDFDDPVLFSETWENGQEEMFPPMENNLVDGLTINNTSQRRAVVVFYNDGRYSNTLLTVRNNTINNVTANNLLYLLREYNNSGNPSVFTANVITNANITNVVNNNSFTGFQVQ